MQHIGKLKCVIFKMKKKCWKGRGVGRGSPTLEIDFSVSETKGTHGGPYGDIVDLMDTLEHDL